MKGCDKKMLELFGQLAPGQQEKLIAFAEFLAARKPNADRDGNGASAVIPRPAHETVATAIRRLVRSYPMLDRRQLMTGASQLMAQHALEGRSAHKVIDDLERVFARHYELQKSKPGGRKPE